MAFPKRLGALRKIDQIYHIDWHFQKGFELLEIDRIYHFDQYFQRQLQLRLTEYTTMTGISKKAWSFVRFTEYTTLTGISEEALELCKIDRIFHFDHFHQHS